MGLGTKKAAKAIGRAAKVMGKVGGSAALDHFGLPNPLAQAAEPPRAVGVQTTVMGFVVLAFAAAGLWFGRFDVETAGWIGGFGGLLLLGVDPGAVAKMLRLVGELRSDVEKLKGGMPKRRLEGFTPAAGFGEPLGAPSRGMATSDGVYFRLGEFASPDTGEAFVVDELLEKLDRLRGAFGGALTVTSGYRTAAHNAAVGGARDSQHLLGRAADIAPASRGDLPRLRDLAVDLGFTGVGYYPSRGFLHVDVRESDRPVRWTESV